mgnify:CR=1 FL=1
MNVSSVWACVFFGSRQTDLKVVKSPAKMQFVVCGGIILSMHVLCERSRLDFAVGVCWSKFVISVVLIVYIVGHIFEVLHVGSERKNSITLETYSWNENHKHCCYG